MAILSVQDLSFIFGMLGNVVSFMLFLAPMPTFYSICKKKTSEGYQSIPYVVTLASASLLLYYAILNTNAFLLLSINAFGCVMETLYLFLFMFYASKKSRMFTFWLILMFTVGFLSLIMVVSIALTKGDKRVTVVGWACAMMNVAMFAAPLSIMRRVIRTKSVEFMPFNLTLFLTLRATMWFFYGFFIKDYYIALPNVLGFLFGNAQMILYFIYMNANTGLQEKSSELDVKNPESGVPNRQDVEVGKV